MMLKAVLFDMDGVLVDVSRSYRRAIEETAAHFTGRDIEAGTTQRYKNLGGFNDDWKLTHAIISDTGIEVSFGRVVHEFQRRYRGENWDGFIMEETPLMATDALQTLCEAGYIMGVVTGRPKDEAHWAINRFGWKRYFPLVVPREKQEGRGKPDPFPLQHALAVLDAVGRTVEPEQAVYIGDTGDDMVAARAAGLWAIGVVPPYLDFEEHAAHLQAKGAHVIMRDMAELPALLADFATVVREPQAAVGQ